MVTGASGGVGRRVCRALARSGQGGGVPNVAGGCLGLPPFPIRLSPPITPSAETGVSPRLFPMIAWLQFWCRRCRHRHPGQAPAVPGDCGGHSGHGAERHCGRSRCEGPGIAQHSCRGRVQVSCYLSLVLCTVDMLLRTVSRCEIRNKLMGI